MREKKAERVKKRREKKHFVPTFKPEYQESGSESKTQNCKTKGNGQPP